jgi:hypothetical protein
LCGCVLRACFAPRCRPHMCQRMNIRPLATSRRRNGAAPRRRQHLRRLSHMCSAVHSSRDRALDIIHMVEWSFWCDNLQRVSGRRCWNGCTCTPARAASCRRYCLIALTPRVRIHRQAARLSAAPCHPRPAQQSFCGTCSSATPAYRRGFLSEY